MSLPRPCSIGRKTKNGLPHSIPLPRQAVEVLDAMAPNRHGLYFPPQQFDPTISG